MNFLRTKNLEILVNRIGKPIGYKKELEIKIADTNK